MKKIPEYPKSKLTRSVFENEILPAKQPVIFRSLVDDWPIVKCAKQNAASAIRYLCDHDNNTPAYTVVGAPDVKGRLFYSDDLMGMNFQSVNAALTSTLEQMLAMPNNEHSHAVSVQAASIRECLPTLLNELTLAVLDSSVEPTLWVSNKSRVAAHFDLNDNIACVAIGRRRFTLFPPAQVANLYVGPTLNSPGGVPTSLVDIQAPDLKRFPNFSQALDQALVAELAPGDAIFIPSPWWHSVESLEPINALINYWWNDHIKITGPTAKNSLMMGMLTIASMDQPQRQAWRDLFDYFVFKVSGNPAEHLPNSVNDIATQLDEQQLKQCYELLRDQLK